MAIAAAKITQTIKEKRYNTLNLLEASFMQGNNVDIYPVQSMEMTELGGEKFTHNMDKPINTYVIFDERPKVNLLQKYGWYRENSDIIPIIAYIPTHLLYGKTQVGNSIVPLEEGEKIMPYDNVYDSTIVTSKSRLLRRNSEGIYEDISNTINLNEGESIVSMASSSIGVLILTSTGRMFSWGTIMDGTWSNYFVLRNTGEYPAYRDEIPAEISSGYYTTFGYSPTNKIEKLYSVPGSNGAIAITTLGRMFTWGHNRASCLFVGTTSLYSYLSLADRTNILGLHAGESILGLYFAGTVSIVITSNRRFIRSGNPPADFTSTWSTILGSEHTLELFANSWNRAMVKTSNNRYYSQLNYTLTEITSYVTNLLDVDESIIKLFGTHRYEFSGHVSTSDEAPWFAITNKGKLISTGILPGSLIHKLGYFQATVVTTLPMDEEFKEEIEYVSLNRNHLGGYEVTMHTNIGRVLSYNVSTPDTYEQLVNAIMWSVVNEVALDGDDVLALTDTGISESYKLDFLDIKRGTIIDIKYDFLTYTNSGDRTSRFYVADVKVDTVSLNYIANLVAYKYKEPDAGDEKTDFKKINFSSDDMII